MCNAISNGLSTRKWAGLLVLALVAAGRPAAEAAPVAYEFTGVVDTADQLDGVAVGDPISGSFRYESDAEGLAIMDQGTLYDRGVGLQFTAGSRFFAERPVATTALAVQDVPEASAGASELGDAFIIGQNANDPENLDALGLGFFDSTGRALRNQLPPVELDLEDFDLTTLVALSGVGSFSGTITSLRPQVVPEPVAAAILGLGLVGLWAARKRRPAISGPARRSVGASAP